MPVTPPISPEAAPQPVKDIYERIKETIGNGSVPIGYQMMGHVEPFLADSYKNYKKYIAEGTGKLDEPTRQILVLATSSAMNCVHCVRSHAKEALTKGLTEQQIAEVLAVTATCAMYNVYYKFKTLSDDPAFEPMSVGLFAHTFKKVSLGEKLVELICIVVSNINACAKCTANHTKAALMMGWTHEQLDEAVRISAVMASFNTYHRTQ